jgi:hypothetical protein
MLPSGERGCKWSAERGAVERIRCVHERMHRGRLEHFGAGMQLVPKRRSEPSHPQVTKECRWRVDARHQQMIPRTGAGDVKQVPFRVVDLFQVRVVGHRLDPCLQG